MNLSIRKVWSSFFYTEYCRKLAYSAVVLLGAACTNSAAIVSSSMDSTAEAMVIDASTSQLQLRQRPIDGPDDWQKRLAEALERRYDCPDIQRQTQVRIGRPIFTQKEGWDNMTPDERMACRAEGDALALSRVTASVEQFPELLTEKTLKAEAYLTSRSNAEETQCESDEELLRQVDMEFRLSGIRLTDEFVADFARVAATGRLDLLPITVSNDQVALDLDTSVSSESGLAVLKISVRKSPELPTNLKWREYEVAYSGDFKAAPVIGTIVDIEDPRPPFELDPLPVVTRPMLINWERDAEWNISSGNYSYRSTSLGGYSYCKHTLNVWSDNSVCKNTITVRRKEISVSAEIYSGSAIDKWRGWLRAKGSHESISDDATQCQLARAQCARYYGTSMLVSPDSWCKGREQWEREQGSALQVCFREGTPGSEVCHFGRQTVRGCVVEKIEPCY